MKVSYETIMRFFRNECTPEEKQAVMQWVNESEEHKAFFFKWEELFYLGKENIASDEAILRKAEKILEARIEKEEDRLSFSFLNALRKGWKYAASIAAIIAVSGLSAWYVLSNQSREQITVSTGAGETLALVLPDSSKVWLNENTVLAYPEAFDGDKRELHLNGEAYFEVTKNKHKPFRVNSKNMSVQVLGTKFNFKSLDNGKTAEAESRRQQ